MPISFRVFAFVAISWAPVWGAEMALRSGAVAPERSIRLDLALSDSAHVIAAYQCDLEYDPAVMEIAVEAGPAATAAGKSIVYSIPSPGHARLLIAGAGQAAIPDGAVAVITVTARRTAPLGSSYSIRLTGPVAADGEARRVPTTVANGSITILAPRQPGRNGPPERE